MKQRFKFAMAIGFAALMLLDKPAYANKLLDQAIREYNAGHYSEAIGLFGEAEPTEFNNAVLHYYLANALSKTNQKEDAAKEYKIALALEPHGQLADYCARALRVLQGLPPGTLVNKGPKLPGNPLVFPPADPLAAKQPPRVIGILCGCPLCHRLEAILHDLDTKFGDRVVFIRSMKDAADPDIQQIIQDYSVTKCPTVLFFDNKGKLVKQFDGSVAEADLRRDTEALASTAGQSQFKNPADEHLAQLRDAIVKDAQARVSDDQRRVDEEIRMIQNEESMQIQDISHRYYRGDDINQIREESQRKITALKKDLEKRRAETFAAATAKIEALSSTAGGRLSVGDQRPAIDGSSPGARLPGQH
jgi:thiol-disulfide isomerase/thioredoxin